MSIALHPTSIATVLGMVRIRPLAPDSDAELVHSWLIHPRSTFWGQLDASVERVVEEQRQIAASPHEAAWILELDGCPIALVETYDPAATVLDSCDAVDHRPGDIGMHILISPPEGKPRHRLTDCLMSATLRWIFSDTGVRRVLVEPDEANAAIHAKNARVGFSQPGTPVALPGPSGTKRALLQECLLPDFLGSPAAGLSAPVTPPAEPVPAGCTPAGRTALAERVHRGLLAKAIRELTHERILRPVELETGRPVKATSGWEDAGPRTTYRVSLGELTVTFEAHLYGLLHLAVDPTSLRVDGDPDWRPDAVAALAGAIDELGIPAGRRHSYLEELSATFAAQLRAVGQPRPTAASLAEQERDRSEAFQAAEAAMHTGHPGFIANTGRVGMGESQLHAFSPELAPATRLVWCAARRADTRLAAARGVEPAALLRELAPWFPAAARRAGLDPAEYVPFPVHPWQWEHTLTTAFSADIASGRLVLLGAAPDLYRPQQSLRTFFNLTSPVLPYVKTAVAVRTMGFTRGISARYMASTPKVNDWLAETLGSDPEFHDNGAGLLPEVLTLAYTGDCYHATDSQATGDQPLTKMTAALLRRSPFDPQASPPLRPEERVVTMAALLYRDEAGRSLLSELVERSGLEASAWVERLMRVYLRPLVHALVAHRVVLMPHTENVILRLQGCAPTGVFHKDLGEEAAVLSYEVELPAEIERLRSDTGGEDPAGWRQKALSIHTDIIDGVLRHLAALLDSEGLLRQAEFWALAGGCLDDYAADHPEAARHGLWRALRAERFAHSTLNRLQLRNPHTMVDIDDQESSLIYAGELPNPLAAPPS